MNIKGHTMDEISEKLKAIVIEHFTGCKLSNQEQSVFQESYSFALEEIEHLIPIGNKNCFKDTDTFNGASGILAFDVVTDNFKGKEYTVMLLSTGDYSKALLLCLLEENESQETNVIVLQNFINEI